MPPHGRDFGFHLRKYCPSLLFNGKCSDRRYCPLSHNVKSLCEPCGVLCVNGGILKSHKTSAGHLRRTSRPDNSDVIELHCEECDVSVFGIRSWNAHLASREDHPLVHPRNPEFHDEAYCLTCKRFLESDESSDGHPSTKKHTIFKQIALYKAELEERGIVDGVLTVSHRGAVDFGVVTAAQARRGKQIIVTIVPKVAGLVMQTVTARSNSCKLTASSDALLVPLATKQATKVVVEFKSKLQDRGFVGKLVVGFKYPGWDDVKEMRRNVVVQVRD
ncbi:uncharacterized protein BXZ73DRAFT_103615 [Epithele typhae]|uniref:uncharacterized protein n=1 Tax=Epithele typhae TaxID=378194 RepID=UPI002007AA4E|nr:uncharacterized protein BXZ73DRAFT_103615 [Epithele typhae]KAH9924324.1 hypothetical protein BXZ73DRAFT_103615 [Epithele typhae]